MENVKVFLSKQFSLGKRDYWRSLIMAALGAAIVAGWEALELALSTGGDFDWKTVCKAAVVTGGGYLIKNLFIERDKIIMPVQPNTGVSPEEVKAAVQESLNTSDHGTS